MQFFYSGILRAAVMRSAVADMMLLIIILMFLIIGVIYLISGSVKATVKLFRLTFHGIRTTAEVQDISRQRIRRSTTWSYTFWFRVNDMLYHGKTTSAGPWQRYSEGEEILIQYDPKGPHNCQPAKSVLSLIIIIIATILSMFILLLTLLMIFAWIVTVLFN
ncbi:MAG: hypothetical protein J6Z40_05055 [Oscillospiraceae bacterium]|nr:hypothetical protein [Oscillospiraceae bacterium]